MKKTVLKISILVIGILLASPSCDDNNGRSLGDISIATVVPEGENAYSFLLDNGKRLWPAAGNLRYPAKRDQRVFLNYTILWHSQAPAYDYDIRVNDIWNILTKQVIELNAENRDSIGNDPLKVKEIWVGGDFLNVSFLFNYGGVRPHLINLVENTLSDDASPGAIALELRHNAYQSTQTRLFEGFACFDLKPFRTNDADSVNLSIKVKGFNGDTTYDVVYRFNHPVAEEEARIPTPVIASKEYY